MITMYNTSENTWSFICPYCNRKNSYNNNKDSPFYCCNCKEELPEFSSLVNIVEERVDYFILAKGWLLGY